MLVLSKRGAYLYRRERKKGSTGTVAGPAKRARQGFSDDGSSSSTQPDGMLLFSDFCPILVVVYFYEMLKCSRYLGLKLRVQHIALKNPLL